MKYGKGELCQPAHRLAQGREPMSLTLLGCFTTANLELTINMNVAWLLSTIICYHYYPKTRHRRHFKVSLVFLASYLWFDSVA